MLAELPGAAPHFFSPLVAATPPRYVAAMAAPGAVRWWAVAVSVAAVVAASWVALKRIRVDSDLTATIPHGSPQLDATRKLLGSHPIVDRVVVDLSVSDGSAAVDRLISAADQVTQTLEQSGLFASVGNRKAGQALLGLYPALAQNLPVLLGPDELRDEVAPRLTEVRVHAAVEQNFEELAELTGVGHASVILDDPLRLRNIALGRLQRIAPIPDARLEGDHVLTADGRHLLVTALPHRSAGDPASSRRLERLFASVAADVERASSADGKPKVMLTVAGAFRSTVDNERILERDTSRAVSVVSVGIIVLLLVCFRRPLLGLLALLPATAGVVGALLVYSIVSPSLSVLSLGFGAALISITVDQGVVFASYLDGVRGMTGREASRECLSATWLTTLTTAGSFLALRISGYPLLAELGTFAALGAVLSFAFVHLVYPWIFRRAPETRRRPLLPLDRWLRRLTEVRAGRLLGPAVALLLALAAFARPSFDADLHALNTVSPETRAAETRIRDVWGDAFSNVYVFLEADGIEALQEKTDRLALFLEEQQRASAIESGWSPSWLYPGPELAARNLRAWREFWTEPRRQALRRDLHASGDRLGLNEDAFAAFGRAVDRPRGAPLPIPPEAHALLGIHRARDSQGWVWLGTIRRGPGYDATAFSEQAAARGIVVFDGRHFGSVFSGFLRQAFLRMLVVVGAFVVLSVAAAFWRLSLILMALAPVGFGLVCTLGTLGWLGRPVDIPGLLLAIVIFGMGIDFSIHFVRGLQRHPRPDAPTHDAVRVAVVLDAGSTLVGMASLAMSGHAALRSAGLAGALGIGFCTLGTFLILPPLQRRVFGAARPWPTDALAEGAKLRRAVAQRYRELVPHVQTYVWIKLRLDPMFPRLRDLVGEARRMLDVGCGHAVPAAWLLCQHPSLRVVGVEPDVERARIAEWVFGDRGEAIVRAAPELPETLEPFDVALLLDVAHYLTDAGLAQTLRGIHARLEPGGRLVLRDTVPRSERVPRERRIEGWLMRRRGIAPQFRTEEALRAMLEAAGFAVTTERIEAREETWFLAIRPH